MSAKSCFTILTLLFLAMASTASAQGVEPVYGPGDFFNYEYTVTLSRSNQFCTVKVFLTVRVESVSYPFVEYSIGDHRRIRLTGDCEVFGLSLEMVENSFRDSKGVDRLDAEPSSSYIGFFANPSYTGEFAESYQAATGFSNVTAKYVNGVLIRYVELTETFFFNSVAILELLSTSAYYRVNPALAPMGLAAVTVGFTLGLIAITYLRKSKSLQVAEGIFLIP
ncbi:hypothetical protein IMZ38_02665 [Thermosphaera chiliense]|uniref:Uncharacterized protein n=1 Tax=Thermosphaera chiliense TaxID=3402707 RepID=A0A7M1URF0_9CREN|nr:hypothetical protein [Thermosphaera aggregans]QOR94840.1 hypothetical protein IMZ38_02665 [Thermosphaera aggregans]